MSSQTSSSRDLSTPPDPKIFSNVHNIDGFSDLIGRPENEANKEAQEDAEKEGCLRGGSTLLISGPPGAGKTTFALATVRAMMAEAKRRQKKDDETKNRDSKNAGPTAKAQRVIAYYISSEVDEGQLIKNFEPFGWFCKEGRGAEPSSFQFMIDSPQPDETNFYAVTPMPEVDRPVPSPEELVNGIFNRISRTLLPGEAPSERAVIYVIVDSITALLKGCVDAGEERRQTHEIVRRLQDRFGVDKLALTILLAEQDHRSQDIGMTEAPTTPTTPSVEDYLADTVFRLYVRSLPLGRRARILEVVKSQGVNMVLGEHTWQIVSQVNVRQAIRSDRFVKEVRRRCSEFEKNTDTDSTARKLWGGIVIFPRPQLLAPPKNQKAKPNSPADRGKPQQAPPNEKGRLSVGTKGLDLAMTDGVNSGTVTLIAGPMGCGKTRLCKQFLNATDEEHNNGTASEPGEIERVLISFDVTTKLADNDRFSLLSFTQSQFDLNVLVAHINWVIKEGCKRLAFDGLSEWITTFDKPQAARVLEALMMTVKRPPSGLPPTVFMTYEVSLDDDPLAPSVLGTAEDNLVVVRQVAINDELRRIIYVLKRQDDSNEKNPTLSHRYPGELVPGEENSIEVNHTSLEAYTDLHNPSRNIKPARVLVQLFDENKAEEVFNHNLVRRLKRQYRQRLDLTSTRFSLAEIGGTLDTAVQAGKPREAFNLAIHSVDEWWLKAGKTGELLQNLSLKLVRDSPDYRDFWWFEVEKAIVETGNGDNLKKSWHAVPGYVDFGMFCINLHALTAPPGLEPEQLRKKWEEYVGSVPRQWATETQLPGDKPGSAMIDWFGLSATESTATVLDYAMQETGQREKDKLKENLERRYVFSFDSSTRETCACMFLELTWAFGGSEAFLAAGSAKSNADRRAANKALKLLQFMVMEGLMPARSSNKSRNQRDKPILFSRQWYSTLRKAQDPEKAASDHKVPELEEMDSKQLPREERNATRAGGLMALPFMPFGLGKSEEALASLLHDVIVRKTFWLRRAKEFYDARERSYGNPVMREEVSSAWTKEVQLFAELTEAGNLLADAKKLLEEDVSEQNQVRPKLKTKLNLGEAAASDIELSWRAILTAYGAARNWLLHVAAWNAARKTVKDDGDDVNPCKGSADFDDLVELTAWAALRLQLIAGNSTGQIPKDFKLRKKTSENEADGVAGALYEARWVTHSMPNLLHLMQQEPSPGKMISTGYVCSGSWMYGIGVESRSSRIQARMLSELSSLDSAEERAELGAGLPARKDFMHLNGSKPVKGMEYLNWREFLRFGGSRARRRDRVTHALPATSQGCPAQPLKDPSLLYATIHQEMLACLRVADLLRQEYASGGAVRTTAVHQAAQRTAVAVAAIFTAVQQGPAAK